MQSTIGQRPITFRSRYIFPVVGPPIADGAVVVDGGRIAAVGCGLAEGEVCDLGNAAILPGLVNAHVHLDFSDLAAPLGRRGIGLADWIRLAMAHRRTTAERDRAVQLGLAESVRAGVTTLAEIAQPDWSLDARKSSPLNIAVFQELIAPTADRVDGAKDMARKHLARRHPHTECEEYLDLVGLSPHAPYSVHPELLSAAIALSTAHQIPIAMHLAESPEELELLRQGTGPLRTLLEELGAWTPAPAKGTIPFSRTRKLGQSPGSRPMDYLRLLASAHRTLVIHGNYLDDEEIAFLATNSARMAAVYCPRSHDWFAYADYPLAKMLAAGVTVALGTDGRGSTPDLSLLAEMRWAAQRHPDVAGDRILHMATLGGARALGRQDQLGALEPGKRADLAVVALPDRDAADPHELLFNSEEPVAATYCGGNLTADS